MHKVLILDFGSQFTQLITRRIRELNIYSEIQPYTYPLQKIIEDKNIKAVILSGGPNSIYEDGPTIDKAIFDLNIPVLGICYGLQLMGNLLGGKVEASDKREYGRAELHILNNQSLFKNLDLDQKSNVWMSHGDHLVELPEGFETIGSTGNCPITAIENKSKKLYGLQFHPEVAHTDNGLKIISNFLFEISQMTADWGSQSFIHQEIQKIKTQVGDKKVLCGLSGGVDSGVTAAIIHKAVGDQLHCMFVDHGLLRMGEREEVEKVFREHFQIKLTVVDATEIFLNRLKTVTDPEQKRKIIGNTFIEVFETASKICEGLDFIDYSQIDSLKEQQTNDRPHFDFLAQGTLYPDVVESISFKGGPSQTIKSHHNVGGLPEKMGFKLIEPLRELFKDEVRKVGLELGLPKELIMRHPFPGPGLAIRIIGDITREKLEILKKADQIFIEELKIWQPEKNPLNQENTQFGESLYSQVWQAFCVLTEVRSVGVMGDGRTYERMLALRAVTASDGMTADWAHLPYPFLAKVSGRIINEVKGINRVVYDISSKPPATIEWE